MRSQPSSLATTDGMVRNVGARTMSAEPLNSLIATQNASRNAAASAGPLLSFQFAAIIRLRDILLVIVSLKFRLFTYL